MINTPSPVPVTLFLQNMSDALPETNIAPENGWLEDEFSYWDGLFSGAMFVSRSVRKK